MKKDNKISKIRIALVNNDFAIGGVQKLIVDLLNFSKDERFEFHLITLMQFNDRGDFYNLVPSNISIHKFNFKNFYDISSWFKLVKLLWQLKFDIVNTNLFFSNTIFSVLKPIFGYKLVSAYRNTESDKPLSYKLADKLLSWFSWKIVTDSQGVADFVAKEEGIPRAKFQVIYNGVDLDKVNKFKSLNTSERERIRKDLAIAPEAPVFLNIARLTAQKGHELMIDSVSFLVHKLGVSQAKLLIIGGGSLHQALKNQIDQHNLQNNVLLLGEKTNIESYYLASDFFLLTSVREGFCITAMTGLAFGLPLISTRVAGVSEYLKDGKNGFFVERDPSNIAEKMKILVELDSNHLESFKDCAKETAQNYSVKRYAESYDDLLSECFEG